MARVSKKTLEERARNQKWRDKNRQHVRDYGNSYYEKNRAKKLEEQRQMLKDPIRGDKRRALQRKYYRIRKRKFKAMGLTVEGTVPKTMKQRKAASRRNMRKLLADPRSKKWREKGQKLSIVAYRNASPEKQEARWKVAVERSAFNRKMRTRAKKLLGESLYNSLHDSGKNQ